MAREPRVAKLSISDQFKMMDINDPGTWPPGPRLVILLAMIFLLIGLAYYFIFSNQLADLEIKRSQEQSLKDEWLLKKRQAVNLDAYKAQLAQIDRSFGFLLRQLPSRSEIDALLTDVNKAGLSRGLEFDLFRPNAEQVKGFYAELPIEIELSGYYHDFGAFAGDITHLSRIVTLNDIHVVAPPPDQAAKIAAQAVDGQGKKENRRAMIGNDAPVLRVKAIAKTFRYLDDAEVAANNQQNEPNRR